MTKIILKPAIFTIFGVTGNLSKRKLLPALYNLAKNDILSASTKIVGITNEDISVHDVMKSLKESLDKQQIEIDEDIINKLEQSFSVIRMDINSSVEYAKLKNKLDEIEKLSGICMARLFYLAIPSTMFGSVTENLGNSGMSQKDTDIRILIEKPFGHDLESAENLEKQIKNQFTEDQIYRIDHYLAKETVQNILTFRFQNPLYASTWNNQHISHIMITVAESIGIEGRVAFYEQMGALRDIVQSHLLQLIALITMEQPASMSANDIHAKKAEVLEQLKPPIESNICTETIKGQYSTYKQEVAADSAVETYAAIKFNIDNERWQGVPILVRTGKNLAEKVTEITIVYKSDDSSQSNSLIIQIQPNEGIVLDLIIKKPGYENETERVQMDFCYGDNIKGSPDAYERVLVDALRGDKTLFATSEEVLASWKAISPIQKAWQSGQCNLVQYQNGSWGPTEADEMAKNAGATWLTEVTKVCSFLPPINR